MIDIYYETLGEVKVNFLKAINAAFVPSYWKGLARAVVPTTEHSKAFAGLSFASLVDVGANVGQFSLFAAHLWPTSTIYAFEPIPDQARRFAALHGQRVQLHRYALGDKSETLALHVASRKDSSSLLPLGRRQKILFNMVEASEIEVPVKRLDEVLTRDLLPKPSLLKIDVQGFEHQVLMGAGRLLEEFSHVFVEVSFIELYENQKLYPDILNLMNESGFSLMGKYNLLKDRDGNDIQADLLFSKNIEN